MAPSARLLTGLLRLSASCIRKESTSRLHTSVVLSHHSLDKTILNHYLNLPQDDKVQVTYVWIDGTGENTRCKTRTMDFEPKKPEDCPKWSFDGSSTGQASGKNSDVFLLPSRLFPDPFTLGKNKLLMCETVDHDMKPTTTNHRRSCNEVVQKTKDLLPLFAFEQEYTLLDSDLYPYGWPKNGFPGPQGPYYCAVGATNVFGRYIEMAHYKACLYSGIDISGTNAEVMPAQWEFQVGPVDGVEIGDQMWMARYLLARIAEEFGLQVSIHPKPIPGDWNGSGNHCNFSTRAMQVEGGMKVIEEAIKRLSKRHKEHIFAYDPSGGEVNKLRLTGLHETASIDEFSSGVAHRGASIRIPRQVAERGYGYLEDRRPSSNCDPYSVAEILIRTCCLNE